MRTKNLITTLARLGQKALRRSHARKSTIILFLASGLTVVSACGNAQQPGEIAPPDVAAAMVARAEGFLRAVAVLSPMPPGTDPDRAQAWPRSPKRRFFDRSLNKHVAYDRVFQTNVVGAEASGAPGKPRAWRVYLYSAGYAPLPGGGEIMVRIDPSSGAVNSFHDSTLTTALSDDAALPSSQWIKQD